VIFKTVQTKISKRKKLPKLMIKNHQLTTASFLFYALFIGLS